MSLVDTESSSNNDLIAKASLNQKALSKISRKLDFTLLSIMVIAATMNGMDRSSLGLSKVVGLESDLGMSGSDFNVAASIMYPTYLLFMLPSNMILRKVGTRIWLSSIIVIWGLVNMSMAFIKNKTGLIICRLFLGATESGFNPGVIMMISLWYPRNKVASRESTFLSSFAISAVIGGPIATGLSKITNKRFKPWGWIFFIEGLATTAYGLIMFFLLSDYPDKSWVLSSEEKELLTRQLSFEQAGAGKRKINNKRVLDHLRDPLIHIQSLVAFFSGFGMNTILIFAPIIVRNMGFSSAASQAMQAAPGICGFVGISLSRYHPKWFRNYCLASIVNSFVGSIGSIILIATTNNSARVFGLCMIGFGSYGNVGVSLGWIMSNVAGPSRSAVAGAAICGYAGLGALSTSYIYRNKDEPRYIFGHAMNLSAALMSVVLVIIGYSIIQHRNRTKDTRPIDIVDMSQDQIDDLETEHPNFRYIP